MTETAGARRGGGAGHSSPGPMHSKAQWRFLFGTHKPFAHRWAEQVEAERGPKTGYRSLPEKTTASARRGK